MHYLQLCIILTPFTKKLFYSFIKIRRDKNNVIFVFSNVFIAIFICIIFSTGRDDNINDIFHSSRSKLHPDTRWFQRRTILRFSTTGYDRPFSIWLLSPWRSAFHQRRLRDCEHMRNAIMPVKEFALSFKLKIRKFFYNLSNFYEKFRATY